MLRSGMGVDAADQLAGLIHLWPWDRSSTPAINHGTHSLGLHAFDKCVPSTYVNNHNTHVFDVETFNLTTQACQHMRAAPASGWQHCVD